MFSVDTTELCLKLHPLGPATNVPVTADRVDTELVVYVKEEKDSSLRQGRCLCRRNSGLASRRSSLCVLKQQKTTQNF